MKSLDTLIKLEQARVDDHRRLLADLQDVLNRIEAEIAALNLKRMVEEEVAREAEPLERVTLEQFLARVAQRLAQLEKARQDAAAAIALERERLAEAFETQKRYEIVRDQRAAAALAEEKRLEQMELDEIAGQSHERKDRHE